MSFVYSHSMLGAHGKCPAQFLLHQRGVARDAEAENFLFGRAFHKFAQLYRDHCIAEQRRSDIEVVPSIINEVFRLTGLSTSQYEALTLLCEQFVFWEPIDIERSLQREAGLALDRNLERLPWRGEFEYDSPNFAHAFVGIDEDTDVCSRCSLSEDDTVHRLFIRMQMDEVLVDAQHATLIIDDFKTDLYVPSQTEIEDPTGRWWQQATEYAWGGLLYLYPAAQDVEFRFKFVRWGVTRVLALHREDVEAYGRTFLRKIQHIEAQREFPARAGEHCKLCPYLRSACPITQKTAKYATPIENLAWTYLHGEAVRERIREELKSHADTSGVVMVGDLPVALFEKAERRILDIEKTLEALAAEGIERPELMLDITPSKLKDKLDADQYERVLEAATAKTEIEVVFNVHQNKAELIALAQRLGIEAPQKMKVAQLAQAIASARRNAA